MGRRSGAETALAIVAAFHHEATWEQSALARRVGVQARTLRSALDDCVRHGMPIERDPENGSRVYWSVPSWWSRRLDDDEMRACIRLVSRLPTTATRDRLLARLLNGTSALITNEAPSEATLRTLEDARARRVVARLQYRSSHDGTPSARSVSIQRIAYGDRTRFVAVCHRSKTLKLFRVDRVGDAALDERQSFVARRDDEIDAFLRDALDGFRTDEGAIDCEFFVRDPEARWVSGVLPLGNLLVERELEGIRVKVRTSAPDVLARFLVGLGDAVRIDTPALGARVVGIAERALGASRVKPLARAGRRNSASASRNVVNAKR